MEGMTGEEVEIETLEITTETTETGEVEMTTIKVTETPVHYHLDVKITSYMILTLPLPSETILDPKLWVDFHLKSTKSS